jgi:ATP-dependent Clp protease ATP-binding subunit ClpC
MSDESEQSDWDKLSGQVRHILLRAASLANAQKTKKVTSIDIMKVLVAYHPEWVKQVIKSKSPGEIDAKMRSLILAPGRQVDQEMVIKRALEIAEHLGSHQVLPVHLAMAAAQYCGFDVEIPQALRPDVAVKLPTLIPTLESYGRDLTAMAAEGKLHPIKGRDQEINLIAETLCRVYKRNPLLVGPAGVGKTAIVEGLASRIASGNVTVALSGKRIFELSMGNLVADTPFRGMFEERMRKVIEEARDPNIILFIDELHSVIGAGTAERSPLDASTILLPALSRGEISCIGATTDNDYHRYIERNKALERRFQPIRISQLTHEDTKEVLKVISPEKFERKYNLKIEDEVYSEVLDLSDRYLRNRYFPDKAIDILDQAVGRAVNRGCNRITVEDVRDVVSSLTGLPIGRLEYQLQRRLEGLSGSLRGRILGQEHIIDFLVDIIWPKALGIDLRPERPNGVFLFVGPTGVGKTESARALAEYLFGSLDKLVRIDMSEYSEAFSVSKFLGAPFGYIGTEKGSPILDSIAENPFSVLLLDEIEKAHPDIHRLFLQVFDSGVLTDVDRKHTFFSDVIIIMTSNLPIKQKQGIGFGADETEVRDQLVKYFSAEFVNRIDFIGLFNPLSPETVKRILENRILATLKDKWQKKGIALEIQPEVVARLAEKGYSKKWGARNLERTVDEMISSPLAKFITKKKAGERIKVRVDIKDGSFEFKPGKK